MEQFKFLIPIAKLFERNKFKLYLVGGCVRDYKLDRSIKDFDLCTDALPDETTRLMKSAGANVIDKNGGNFGTVHCVFDGKEVEITTFRKDKNYPAGDRRPEVEFSNDLNDDLVRRDFTINAMAMDLYGNPAGYMSTRGDRDLREKFLTSPQNPDVLFQDDPLRIMRMYRFACRLGFDINPIMRQSARDNASRLEIVRRERIHSELVQIAGGNEPHIAFRMMMEDGVLQNLFNGLALQVGFNQRNKHHHLPLWEHTLKAVENAYRLKANYQVILAALLHDIGKPFSYQNKPDGSRSYKGHDVMGSEIVYDDLANLKFSNKDIDNITKMVYYHISYCHDDWDNRKARRYLNKMGELANDHIILMRADRLSHAPGYNDCNSFDSLEQLLGQMDKEQVVAPKALLSGTVISDMLNVAPGPELGAIIKALKQAQIDGDVLDKSQAKHWLIQRFGTKENGHA
jgi:poly(A) polymerase